MQSFPQSQLGKLSGILSKFKNLGLRLIWIKKLWYKILRSAVGKNVQNVPKKNVSRMSNGTFSGPVQNPFEESFIRKSGFRYENERHPVSIRIIM